MAEGSEERKKGRKAGRRPVKERRKVGRKGRKGSDGRKCRE
jgi:hypothetical protein